MRKLDSGSIFSIPPDFDYKTYIEKVEAKVQGDYFVDSGSLVDVMRDHFANRSGRAFGDETPWVSLSEQVRFKMGEVSLWAGYNGHKKSMFTGMVALWLARTKKVCVASLELPIPDTLQRMTQQAAGCWPSPDFAANLMDRLGGKLFMYDELASITPNRLLGMIYYAANELGCEHIFIDSLTKCGIATDNLAGQKELADKVVAAAKALNVHVHLVAHLRKPANQAGAIDMKPSKYDIRGASELSDLAHNVYIVYANRRKRLVQEKQKEGALLSEQDLEFLDRPDMELLVAKQRNMPYEGELPFWFNDQSLQFLTDNRSIKLIY